MEDEYRVYWQPGCSSCLRAKEFLKTHGIAFKSINVREQEGGMDELASLGARTVPVVAKGNRFVFCQDLNDLAEFVGVNLSLPRLSPADLVAKLDLVLGAAQRYVVQLSGDTLDTGLPGRDRTYRDLAYHVFMIPVGFLDAARGGELTFEHFEQKPPEAMRTAAQVASFGDAVRQRLAEWWSDASALDSLEPVMTYYGVKSAESVLERTAWHAAQHTRQLMAVVQQSGVTPDGPLGEDELGGLPLPDEVYDDEIALAEGD